jgi:hypothetical protein
MTGLLTPYFSGGVAAVLSIAVRLWTIATELIGGSAAVLLVRSGPAVAGAAPVDTVDSIDAVDAAEVPVPRQP